MCLEVKKSTAAKGTISLNRRLWHQRTQNRKGKRIKEHAWDSDLTTKRRKGRLTTRSCHAEKPCSVKKHEPLSNWYKASTRTSYATMLAKIVILPNEGYTCIWTKVRSGIRDPYWQISSSSTIKTILEASRAIPANPKLANKTSLKANECFKGAALRVWVSQGGDHKSWAEN